MRVAELEICNKRGLHARAAARLVHAASGFKSHVTVECRGEEADGKSILSLMVLGAACGATVTLRVEGPDEDAAVEALSKLIGGGFEEGD